jgi:hypothetical protein
MSSALSALKKCCEDDRGASRISESMERELTENKSLILNDLELKVDQIPSLCRFLTSKEV